MKDLYHNVLATQVLSPAVATTAQTSSAIDMKGYDALTVLFALGQSGDTLSGSVYWTLKLQHSDTDSGYEDVEATELHNGVQTIVVDSSSEDEKAYAMGYLGGKRYVKAVATPTGTHSNGTPVGITALRGYASLNPVL